MGGQARFTMVLQDADVDTRPLRLAAEGAQPARQPMELDTITLDLDVAIGVVRPPRSRHQAEVLLSQAGLERLKAAKSSSCSGSLVQHPGCGAVGVSCSGAGRQHCRRRAGVGEIEGLLPASGGPAQPPRGRG